MRRWNLDGLYRHAQGVKERSKGVRRSGKLPPRQPWICPKCEKSVDFYRATHLEICNGK